MESNTIEAGNKLIAEFMGWTKDSQGFWTGCSKGPHFKLTFHSSWNELMPVVEKIESLPDDKILYPAWNNVKIWQVYCEIKYKDFHDTFARESKIAAVWYAIVEFIEWFTTQSK